MNNKICIDLFTPTEKNWMRQYDPVKVSGQKGTYFTVTVDEFQKKDVLRKAHKSGIKYRFYDQRWARSSTYRDDFFRLTKGPYRCRYCQRWLSPKYMVVDHIVPVGQVKKSPKARRMLERRGIHNVNDIRNLAPSCSRCNNKKSDKLGKWYWRGRYGDKFWFRTIDKFWWMLPAIIIVIILLQTHFVEHMSAIFPIGK